MKDINIAKNIIALRKNKGITQEQLAEALNISAQAVSKWETGACQPDTLTLPLIAEYFNVSIDYLYYGYEYTYEDIYHKIWDNFAFLLGVSDNSNSLINVNKYLFKAL